MEESILLQFAVIVLFGVGAQWIAWRFRLPSILLLLILGFAAGPVTGFLDPDALFGDLLLPAVSLSVGIILFEGGLSLRFDEIAASGKVVRNLVTVGAAATLVFAAAAAHVILGFDLRLAVLLGAILVVTGPTVVGPLLGHIRPVGVVGPILKWEGILIDPIGALLAVLAFEAIVSGDPGKATLVVAGGIVLTLLVGFAVGLAAAFVLGQVLRRYWVPEFLHNPVTLTLVAGAFVAANHLHAESGLLAVTLMGIALANQKKVDVRHIVEFKENLRVLFIGCLFILLAARLDPAEIASLSGKTLLFLGVLVLLVRPVAVALSTLGSGLAARERAFLAWMAPRGIVAAAVASVFALRLEETGHAGADRLVPVTFAVIVATVALYGLTSLPVARRLRLAVPNPRGALILGAHSWARGIGRALREAGFRVLLVDRNWKNVAIARMEGFETFYGNVLSEGTWEEIGLGGLGHFFALTGNDEVNALSVQRFTQEFGRGNVYQLAPQNRPEGRQGGLARDFHGRILFAEDASYDRLSLRFLEGAEVKTTRLTEEFDAQAFARRWGKEALPLFRIDETGDLAVFTTDARPALKAGQRLVSLVAPAVESEGKPAVPSGKETA